jgi:DoxX-like family
MKKTKILYWIFTALFAAFMLFTAIPDILLSKEAVVFMQQLGYPDYFTVFIGVAKTLGAVALLIPGFPRLKEWAYAGLFFDLIGAVYSIVAIHGFSMQLSFMLIPFVLGILSYIFFHKLYTAKLITV